MELLLDTAKAKKPHAKPFCLILDGLKITVEYRTPTAARSDVKVETLYQPKHDGLRWCLKPASRLKPFSEP
jgi:hypothetical protein